MPCLDSEKKQCAPAQPGFSTLTKAIWNEWVCHARLDAEESKAELDSNVEKQLDESTGKKARVPLLPPIH
jgi:hypothetical protein